MDPTRRQRKTTSKAFTSCIQSRGDLTANRDACVFYTRNKFLCVCVCMYIYIRGDFKEIHFEVNKKGGRFTAGRDREGTREGFCSTLQLCNQKESTRLMQLRAWTRNWGEENGF